MELLTAKRKKQLRQDGQIEGLVGARTAITHKAGLSANDMRDVTAIINAEIAKIEALQQR